ncbi:hypothetical protein evm_002677 [Chilo suppressalis]|nr:hypothetical protein evm_002677 [Chilo suppressalis]
MVFYKRHRVAVEAQLLAEEKWILSALEKIKNQRNCLQIERLQLESMKNKLKSSSTSKVKSPSHENHELKGGNTPVTFSLSMMQKAPDVEATCAVAARENFFEAEALCNNEKLDLNVTKPSQMTIDDLNTEECEEDFEEEEDVEDFLIDMNMLMHGGQL